MNTIKSLLSRVILLSCAGMLGISPSYAEDSAESFLLRPEKAITALAPSAEQVTLAPVVDGTALSFTSPQILISRNDDKALFISAVWKDAAGQVTHQRNVFVVKPDYGVVVDYIYGKGQHGVLRHFALPGAQVASDAKSGQFSLADGKTLRIQALDTTSVVQGTPTSGKPLDFSSSVNAPVPLVTVFAVSSGSAAPQIEYVKPANPMIVKFKVTFPDQRVDQIALGWEARPLHIAKKEFNGWAACLCTGSGTNDSIEIR